MNFIYYFMISLTILPSQNLKTSIDEKTGDPMKTQIKNALILFVALFTLSAQSSQSVEKAQLNSMQQVIETQLDAFARGDATMAYAQASPLRQARFPNQDIFMTMFRQS